MPKRTKPRDPVGDLAEKWGTRAQQLGEASGLEPGKVVKTIMPLFKEDLKTVKRGGPALTEGEAVNATLYNLTGDAPVEKQSKDTGLNPLNIVQNAVGDIKDITLNAVPGLVDFASKTVIPKNLMEGPENWEMPDVLKASTRMIGHGGDAKWLKEHGYDPKAAEFTPEGFAAALRLLGKPEQNPGEGKNKIAKQATLWSLAPGLWTAANATTEEGRAEMTGRPLMTALDVLPAAGSASKIVGAGLKGAEVGGALGKVAEASEKGTRLGAVAEAASEGKPLKTVYRAAVPVEQRAAVAERVTDLMNKMHMGPKHGEIARGVSITGRESAGEIKDFVENKSSTYRNTGIIEEFGKMTKEEQALISDEALNPNKYVDADGNSTISTEHRATINELENVSRDVMSRRKGMRELRIKGHDVWYEGESPVTRWYDKERSSAGLRSKWQVKYNDIAKRTMDRHMAKWTGELQRALAAEKRFDPKVTDIDKKIVALERERELAMLPPSRKATPGTKASYDAVAKQERKRIAIENKIDRLRSSKTKALRPLNKARRQIEDSRLHIRGAVKEVNEVAGVASARKMRDRYFMQNEAAKNWLNRTVEKTPPENYLPMIQNEETRLLIQSVAEKDPALASDLGETAIQINDFKVMARDMLSPEELQLIENQAMAKWIELADEGHNPIWVEQHDRVSIKEALRRTPLNNSSKGMKAMRHSLEDQAPSMTNVAIGVTGLAYENIFHDASQGFVKNTMEPLTHSYDDVRGWAERRLERERKRGKYVGEDDLATMRRLAAEQYVIWDPKSPFTFRKPTMTPKEIMANHKYVPKAYAETIERLVHPYAKTEIGKFGEKATRVFKASVLTFSVKHLADEFFGNFAFMMLRGHADTMLKIPEAFRMLREDKLPVDIPTQIEFADGIFAHESGTKLGRLYQQVGGSVWKAKEVINNMYRAMDYLGEKSFLKRTEGVSDEVAHMRAVEHTRKALMDLDSMTVVERGLLRQALPFYSFIRYSFKYLMTYPTDYPVRASILSTFARIEAEDASSGLPQIFGQMFQLGSPDDNGDVSFLDTKVMNPFRDMGNYFTPVGFFSSLNPMASIPLELAGFNTYAGASELYPEMTMDPKTGSLIAKRPGGAIGKAIEGFIPETKMVDYMLGLSDEMRYLKENDPQAYSNKAWDLLFIPGKKTYNVNEEKTKLAKNWFAIAQQQVAQAMKYPDRAGEELKGYEGKMVPYQGAIVPTEQVKALIKMSEQIAPGESPGYVLPQGRPKDGQVFGMPESSIPSPMNVPRDVATTALERIRSGANQ